MVASARCSFFLADIILGMVEQQQPHTVSRDSNHTVSNSKPAELLQQTTRGFQAAGIVREYPDRGNSPHAVINSRGNSTKQDATFLGRTPPTQFFVDGHAMHDYYYCILTGASLL